MNGFQHLPEYASAAHAYRMERTHVERAPRRASGHPSLLRRLATALVRTRTATPTSAVRGSVS